MLVACVMQRMSFSRECNPWPVHQMRVFCHQTTYPRQQIIANQCLHECIVYVRDMSSPCEGIALTQTLCSYFISAALDTVSLPLHISRNSELNPMCLAVKVFHLDNIMAGRLHSLHSTCDGH